MKFGTLVDGQIQYANDSGWIDGSFYTKLTTAQHRALGEKRIYENPAPAVLSSGFHWEKDGWIEQEAGIIQKWKLVEDQMTDFQPENSSHEQNQNQEEEEEEQHQIDDNIIRISKSKVEAVIDEMEMTDAFMAWLQSKASYFGSWMRSGDVIEYDPMDNESDLASLLEVLQLSREDVAALLEEVRA